VVSDLLGRDALGLQKRGDGVPAVAPLGVRAGHVHHEAATRFRRQPGRVDAAGAASAAPASPSSTATAADQRRVPVGLL